MMFMSLSAQTHLTDRFLESYCLPGALCSKHPADACCFQSPHLSEVLLPSEASALKLVEKHSLWDALMSLGLMPLYPYSSFYPVWGNLLFFFSLIYFLKSIWKFTLIFSCFLPYGQSSVLTIRLTGSGRGKNWENPGRKQRLIYEKHKGKT